ALLIAITVAQTQKARLRSRQLQEGKEAFERLFDASTDGLLVVGRDGRIVRANRRIEALFGYSPREIMGQPVESLVPVELGTLLRAQRLDYFHHPEVRQMGPGLDLHGRRKDGSDFPAEISLSPLQAGDEVQVLASVRDIRERKHAEELL